MATQVSRSDQRLAFTFGVIFLLILLGLAVFRPNPSPFEYTVYRIVLALAAGGVGAVLPGFLHVDFRWARASGALALFLLVYFAAPAAIQATIDPNPKESSQNPIPRAESWLKLVDKGEYDEAYRQTSPQFRSRFNKDAMTGLLRTERASLGNLVSRQLLADQPYVNPPGSSPGAYRAIGFVTRFSKFSEPIYEAVQLRSEDKSWNVVGFYTSVKTDAGAFVPYVAGQDPATRPQGNVSATDPESVNPR